MYAMIRFSFEEIIELIRTPRHQANENSVHTLLQTGIFQYLAMRGCLR